MEATSVRCGASRATVNRSDLSEIAGYGRDASHHAFYRDGKLLLITTTEGAVCAFSLAHPKELHERKQALHLLHVQDCVPGPGPVQIVCDKGFARAGIEKAAAGLGFVLVRPAHRDEPDNRRFPSWLRQRIEAVIWTLKNQLGLERHAARTTEGSGRGWQRVCALNMGIWRNWLVGASVKRSLVAYDH